MSGKLCHSRVFGGSIIWTSGDLSHTCAQHLEVAESRPLLRWMFRRKGCLCKTSSIRDPIASGVIWFNGRRPCQDHGGLCVFLPDPYLSHLHSQVAGIYLSTFGLICRIIYETSSIPKIFDESYFVHLVCNCSTVVLSQHVTDEYVLPYEFLHVVRTRFSQEWARRKVVVNIQ